MASAIFNDEQKVRVVVKPVTAKGRPAVLVGVPEWVSSNMGVVEPIVDADGMAAWLQAIAEGTAVVTVNGVNTVGTVLTATVDCAVTVSPATVINLEVGTPEMQ